jgi:polar amino acid transport system permease protein
MATWLSRLELLSYGDRGWGDELLTGAWLTLQISSSAYLVGICIGLVGAGAKLSGFRPALWIADVYTTIVRAVPELLLIILLYYAGSSALKSLLVQLGFGGGVDVDPFFAAVSALGFVQGAYTTEIFRGAILSVPRGQMEAARAIGMGTMLRFRRILLPLMMRYALPGLSNLWLNILKDSTLVSVVGFSDLLFTGKTAAGSTKLYFFFLSVTAVAFLVLNLWSNIVIYLIERRATRGFQRS